MGTLNGCRTLPASASGDLDFEDARSNLLQTIQTYRGLWNAVVPNNDARDDALVRAISNATTWTQLGILGTQLSPRSTLLQKSIGGLGHSYLNAVAPRFDEGNTGWYWTYGTNMAVDAAYLVCIFRFPTAPHSTAVDSFYCVSGYVVDRGMTRPFSTYGMPIMCPGAYTVTKRPDELALVMDLSMYLNNANVSLSRLTLRGTGTTLRNMTVDMALKKTSSSLSTTMDTYSASMVSPMPGAFQGPHGCAPCVDGAGSSYWSFTYLTGGGVCGFSTSTSDPASGPATGPASVSTSLARRGVAVTHTGHGPGPSQTPSPSPSPSPSQTPSPTYVPDMVGWFSHQWTQLLPRNVFARALLVVTETMITPEPEARITLTLQPSPVLQYTVTTTYTNSERNRIAVGSTHTASYNVFVTGMPTTFNQRAVLTITAMLPGTALPSAIMVTLLDTDTPTGPDVLLIQAACDGRVTEPDGSVNLDAVSRVFNQAGNQLGVGCISISNFGNLADTTTHMMRLSGLDVPVSVFMPAKYTSQESGTAAALISVAVIVPIVFIVLIIVLAVVLTPKKSQK